jgi:hypothetical protein
MSYMSALDILAQREDEGCEDCGATDCTCDSHCGDCGRPYRDEDEQERGQCDPCYGEALDAQRDEVGR